LACCSAVKAQAAMSPLSVNSRTVRPMVMPVKDLV
jgi:hypothetical protein